MKYHQTTVHHKTMQNLNSVPNHARLALPGLPDLTDSLIEGGLYILLAETAAARFPILASSLASGLESGLNCRLLLQQNPETIVQRLQSYGNLDIHQAIQDRQLQLFTMQDEFSKKMFRFGAEAFIKELEHFAFPDGAYVVFDQADDLLALHDVLIALDQVDVLKKWTQLHQMTFLLVLTRTTQAHASTLNALMDNLTGIARVGAQRNGLELTFDYWQSNDGTTAGRSFNLKQLSSGLYEATHVQQLFAGDAAEVALERMDETDAKVFFMDADLMEMAESSRGKWQKVDTFIGMLHVTRNIRSATCVLLFQRGSQLRQLAETVHTLRLTLGRYARIVVQEKEASLRYLNEALLLKLGLNLVINRDVPLSRVPLLLESLKGQIFSRDVDINFETALASVLPTQLHGYLLPNRFAKEVALILERAKTLDVPCALVIARPHSHESLPNLIQSNQISRAGDLMTADTQSCFVFLNACPQSVLFNTLERLLGVKVDDAFSGVRFAVNPEEILAELEALLRTAGHEVLPDFTPEQENTGLSAAGEGSSISSWTEPFHVDSTAIVSLLPKVVALAKPDKPRPIKSEPSISALEKLPKTLSAPQAQSLGDQLIRSSEFSKDMDSDKTLFEYDELMGVSAFGKQQAPRATRAFNKK